MGTNLKIIMAAAKDNHIKRPKPGSHRKLTGGFFSSHFSSNCDPHGKPSWYALKTIIRIWTKAFDLIMAWKNADYPNKYPINTSRGTKLVTQK